MHSKFVLAGGLVAAALVAAACGAAGPYAAAPSAAPTAQPSVTPVVTSPSPISSPPASGTTIGSTSTRLGRVLVGANGRTVYLVYTGPRQFQAGEPVRVHVSDAGVFIL